MWSVKTTTFQFGVVMLAVPCIVDFLFFSLYDRNYYIRPLLTVDTAKSIAASIVGTRLDYCNSLLYGT